MDPRIRSYSSSLNGVQMRNHQPDIVSVDQNISNVPRFETVYQDLILGDVPRFEDHYVQPNYDPAQFFSNEPISGNLTSSSALGIDDDFNEDCDLSDAVLTYINRMLMEEDMEDKTCMLQESLELQAKEQSFYEALGKTNPQSTEINGALYNSHNGDSLEIYTSENHQNNHVIRGYHDERSDHLINSSWIPNQVDFNYGVSCEVQNYPSNVSICSSNSLSTVVDGLVESPVSPVRSADAYNESQLVWNFNKGVEEANKYLPTEHKLLINLDFNGHLLQEQKGIRENNEVKKEETREEETFLPTGSRGRKNPYSDGIELEEGRRTKQAAVYTESPIRSEEFDMVLLHSMGKGEAELKALRTKLIDATRKKVQQNAQPKGSNRGKGRGRRQSSKKEVIDLRTLLINCAQAVAADDRCNASELVKQIRQHSSPFGDGNQRLANCFADGLEARLAGIGSQIYKTLVNKRTSAANYLKAYQTYLASSPFRKISVLASNKTAMLKAHNATRVHVIDFGILYGFQWPTFMQRLAGRDGGPPKLRITGIEFPQPGFRPAERIEETGRRLADYAKTFNVPFEYNAIAKKWETIRVEELKIQKDEFLFINCLYRFKNLHDETVASESSRTAVLNLISKIKPDIFIHGTVNGAYSAPFFVTRFREALFHFSALFDMLETNVPREMPERMLIEREIFGREAMNVIACEGWERVERPETYKQWQVRHLRAGFTQIPFPREIMNLSTDKVRSNYHKDFVIGEDNQWLLLGWKGRIIYALSCWTAS
ncbi:hypothetical protein LIER_11101 [Lithospermum erythrorhizon]|uniref:Scarecrow-like protein 9 n=1 Tax=Lithospermum erythrorhizon TaxID=34254 RepID=A0AAV3PNJ9_LITER